MNEYDQRQYKLMKRFIRDYELGNFNLGNLIANLEGLKCALTNPSPTFSASFLPFWGGLEETYAVMLDEQRTTPNEIDKRIIDESLTKLKALIQSELASE